MCLEGNFSGGESSYWLISKGISSTSIYFQRQFACSHVRDCEKVTCKLIRVPLLSGRKITVLPPIWNAMILGSSFRWIEPRCPFLREGNVNRLDEKIFRSRCCAHWLISSPRRENNQVSSVSVCRAFELELSEVIVKRISPGVERDLGGFIYFPDVRQICLGTTFSFLFFCDSAF